jgi:hypothetical protein
MSGRSIHALLPPAASGRPAVLGQWTQIQTPRIPTLQAVTHAIP